MSNKDELAALKARVAELEARTKPPEPPKPFKPMSDAEWRDQMHQMQERRMSMATPPSVIRDWAVLDDATVKGVVRDNRNAPLNPTGAIPRSGKISNERAGGVPGGGTGWQAPIPLSNPPGVAQADRLMDEADRRDRLELAERLAKQEAMQKLAEGNKP